MRKTMRMVFFVLVLISTYMMAGDIDSPAAPSDAGSAMYTLEDIYNKLDTRVDVSKRTGAFAEPAAAPGSTGHTTDDIMGLINYRAPVAKTGMRTSQATNDDGDQQRGVAWPNPRFTDNSDGTVTDNLTGLIWLKDANAFEKRSWYDALSDCASLNSGEAGLTDGSREGDWRLPNIYELISLIDYNYFSVALCNTAGTGKWSEGDPFTNVQGKGVGYYWTSTPSAYGTDNAWNVYTSAGNINIQSKTSVFYVWPVRGGE